MFAYCLGKCKIFSVVKMLMRPMQMLIQNRSVSLNRPVDAIIENEAEMANWCIFKSRPSHQNPQDETLLILSSTTSVLIGLCGLFIAHLWWALYELVNCVWVCVCVFEDVKHQHFDPSTSFWFLAIITMPRLLTYEEDLFQAARTLHHHAARRVQRKWRISIAI